MKRQLFVLGSLLPLIAAGQNGPPTASVNVTNTTANPVPVTVTNTNAAPVPVAGTVEPAHPRIFISGLVSLENGVLSAEPNTSSYDVPLGKVLVIESVHYNTNAACFFRYVPTLRVDRPIMGGFRFDRYDLAVVSPVAFTSGGGAFLSADIHRVSINAPALSSVKFGFSRNSGDCFGQVRFLVDGRLESLR